MQLTSAQTATFKTWLTNNAAGLSDQDAATLANAIASPAYWVWRTSTSVADIYTRQDDAGNYWNWTTYIQQSAVQQDGWKQMFIVGQACNLSLLNNRQACGAIYGNTGAGGAARDHIFAIGRRLVTNLELLFVVAVASPPSNTGNDGIAGNRGKVTNPDLLGTDANGSPFEGLITSGQVAETRG